MRWAKSYSIVDHQLLHGGYLHRLGHKSMSLYLFLLVVGDREGRSYYSEATIMDILHFDECSLAGARDQLMRERLIEYRRPHWWVKNISSGDLPKRKRSAERKLDMDDCSRRTDRKTAQKHLKRIFDVLSNGRSSLPVKTKEEEIR